MQLPRQVKQDVYKNILALFLKIASFPQYHATEFRIATSKLPPTLIQTPIQDFLSKMTPMLDRDLIDFLEKFSKFLSGPDSWNHDLVCQLINQKIGEFKHEETIKQIYFYDKTIVPQNFHPDMSAPWARVGAPQKVSGHIFNIYVKLRSQKMPFLFKCAHCHDFSADILQDCLRHINDSHRKSVPHSILTATPDVRSNQILLGLSADVAHRVSPSLPIQPLSLLSMETPPPLDAPCPFFLDTIPISKTPHWREAVKSFALRYALPDYSDLLLHLETEIDNEITAICTKDRIPKQDPIPAATQSETEVPFRRVVRREITTLTPKLNYLYQIQTFIREHETNLPLIYSHLYRQIKDAGEGHPLNIHTTFGLRKQTRIITQLRLNVERFFSLEEEHLKQFH